MHMAASAGQGSGKVGGEPQAAGEQRHDDGVVGQARGYGGRHVLDAAGDLLRAQQRERRLGHGRAGRTAGRGGVLDGGVAAAAGRRRPMAT